MAEDPNTSGKEQRSKHATANGVPTDDRLPHSDATKPCSHGMNRRNLIVCIDGTANQFGEKNTNVIELYNLILKKAEHNQRTWYNSGIGTYARPSWKSPKFYQQVLSHKIDLAIAWNFERTILAAYQWLSDNYEENDCIFLFGFSRGAYQVRVLSAMIDKVGLIYKGNETQIPFAYELYSDPKSDEATVSRVGSSKTEEKMSMAQRFKKTFSYEDVRVHFVGAWDTVSSIGIARAKHILPGTAEGMKHVCFFRHALALDERRVKFLPEYAYGGTANPLPKPEDEKVSPVNAQSPHDGNNPSTANTDSAIANNKPSDDGPIDNEAIDAPSSSRINSMESRPHTIEVWFAGTHSDIGGGNVENAGMDRSRPPLRWIVFEAGALGLRTVQFERELSPDEQIHIKESLTASWWPLEFCWFNRLTYTRKSDPRKQYTHKPHLGSPRKIHPGQKIHSSLMLSNNTKYTPKARPLDNDPGFWEKVRRKGLGDWLERDLYEYTLTLVKSLVGECPDIALQTLEQTAMSADGRQAVYEGVIAVLENLGPEDKRRLLHSAVDILGKSDQGGTPLKLSRSIKICPLVSDLLEGNTEHDQKVMQQFLVQFTDFCVRVIEGSTHSVLSSSVASSPVGWCIVSGSGDNTVRIWDAETGEPVAVPFQGESVAFSPDGGYVVSGLVDKTVRIWGVGTGKPVGEPFRGHTGSVKSVTFSPDGRWVVSGSHDRTIRMWDAEMGKSVGEPFRGHTGSVQSVAFSPDGRRIASGSVDMTVRIWDVETGKPVGEPFKGHTDSVQSVAFSPNGRHIVSGSYDKTVRIWDAETGKQVGEPFRGHRGWIESVAFSPEGRRIVSGSHDNTVQIWDAETGKPAGEPFRGHTDWVSSVTFSPDGTRIVSGSHDGTVRVWDAEMGKPFRGDIYWTQSVAFSPDGGRVVSGSVKGVLRIWDVEAADRVARL